jgi:hypothetical protein
LPQNTPLFAPYPRRASTWTFAWTGIALALGIVLWRLRPSDLRIDFESTLYQN